MNSTLALSSFSSGAATSDALVSIDHRADRGPATSSRKLLPSVAPTLEIVPAIHGNHFAIESFLQRLLQRSSPAEFASETTCPGYDPAQRLLIKSPVDRSLAAHVHLQPQRIRFGTEDINVIRFRDLASLPEYHGAPEKMVLSAESQAKAAGAPLLLAKGEDHKLLQRLGWVSLGVDPVSAVSPHALLGQLPAPPVPESPFYADQIPNTEVRIGRLTDVEELQRLHETKHHISYGIVSRSAEYWSWLVGRRSHSRIYVFAEEQRALGYVVVRGASIVELVDLTPDAQGSARLLSRVASDAIEQGRHSLRIHAPVSDVVHQWVDQAGGSLDTPGSSETWMAKCVCLRSFLKSIARDLNGRPHSLLSEDVSLRLGKQTVLIRKGSRGLRIVRGKPTKHSVEMTSGAATQLVLGYRSPRALLEANRLFVSSQLALDVVTQLFPALPLWRGRWDDVAVMDS